MRKMSEQTLAERAGYLYRQLLLLACVFGGDDDGGKKWPANTDDVEGRVVHEAVREVLAHLAEETKLLMNVPFPIRDWRPGDNADDERWRPVTEVERRELWSLLVAHENLIACLEDTARRLGEPGRHEYDGLARPSAR